MKISILYEDNDILVIHKPAGLATQTGQVGRPDAASEVKNYLAAGMNRERRAGGAQAPFVGMVHRLDQPVEGILVFGRTPKATAALNRQLTGRELHKQYYAVVCGQVPAKEGELVDYLCRDARTNASFVVAEEEAGNYADVKKAMLTYRVLDEGDGLALLDIHIGTGRHHQIRVQMSHAGLPLLGDSKYGSRESLQAGARLGIRNVALCAYTLSFNHPVTGKELSFRVEPQNPAYGLFKNHSALRRS